MSKNLPTVAENKVPAPFFDDVMEMEGMGVENVTLANMLLPRIVVLQALSPQLNKKKIEYIEGASVGDFCNVATGDIFNGPIEMIPCHFATIYLEWKAKRGGLAMNHGLDASILKQTTLNEKRQNILPNGNQVAETATWYCMLNVGEVWHRVFLPCSSTNLKVSRRWMTLFNTLRVKTSQGMIRPPLFYMSWWLEPAEDSNDQGAWATFSPKKGRIYSDIDPTKSLLEECKNFYLDAKNEIVKGDLGIQDELDPNRSENAHNPEGRM